MKNVRKMVSKLNIIGLVILLLGVIPFILFTFIGFTIPPFVVRGPTQFDSYNVSAGSTQTVDMGSVGAHPLPVILKVSFIIDHNVNFDCEVTLLIDSENPDIGLTALDPKPFFGEGFGRTQKSIQVTIIPPGSSSPFSVDLDVENTGSSPFTIEDRRIQVTFTLWASVFPAFLAFVGVIITVVGLIQARRGPAVPKKPKVIPGWEPTLQWSSSAAGDTKTAGRKPKMAVRSTKAAKHAKKTVVRRAAPTSGAQASCKFCGKSVSATAFFCPHCYGKLR